MTSGPAAASSLAVRGTCAGPVLGLVAPLYRILVRPLLPDEAGRVG